MRSGFGTKGGKIDSSYGLKTLNDQYPSIVKYFRDNFGSNLALLIDCSRGYTTNPVTSIDDQASGFKYTIAAGGSPTIENNNGYQTLYFTTQRFRGALAFTNYTNSSGISVIFVTNAANASIGQSAFFFFENSVTKTKEWGSTWQVSATGSFQRSWNVGPDYNVGGFTYSNAAKIAITNNATLSTKAIKIEAQKSSPITYVSRTSSSVPTPENTASGSFVTGSVDQRAWPPDFNWPLGGFNPLNWDGYAANKNMFMYAVIANAESNSKLQDTMHFLANYYKLPADI